MNVIHLGMVDSTNDEAKRRIASGEGGDEFCIHATGQSAGRGTRGRHWSSPKGAGLYFSYVLASTAAEAPPPTVFYTLAAGVACAEALRAVCQLPVKLKPVNDLMVETFKIGGILTETMVQSGGMRALIIGVGINLQRAPRRVRVKAPAAAALEDLLDPRRFQALDAGVLMETLLERLVEWTGRALREEHERIRTAWLQHAIDGATCPIEEDQANN